MRFVDQLKVASATGEQEARECKQQASEKRFAEYQARKDAHAQGIVTRVMTNFEENVMLAAKSGRRSMRLYRQHGDN